ncbi:Uma2 family endonuclease [Tumebacillus flagellatus]|uniref:Putative restriction endonuclease domain-containing protein n=1 Tax=Tumebacillus flagellatus TaxID=1157490 RepID=A0A074M7K3_9BACL|nr:Uma2 family endonuclease [Tumebacillus flagellatus]KEO81977.1 hypothetical protein EL26_17545 [Tumebacillus flagellatus]
MVKREHDLSSHRQVSYAEYLERPEATEPAELINGVLYNMTPTPSPQHQRVVRELMTLFHSYLKGKSCEVFSAPFDVRLFAEGKNDDEVFDVVQPDVFVVCDKNKIDHRGCNGSPDLVIEALSPATLKRDKVEKMHLYRLAKVKEYWIVDPDRGFIDTYVFLEDRFPEIRTYTAADQDVIRVRLFEDLEIVLSDVFHF